MRYTPLVLLLITVLVAILSWLGSVYDWGLYSLLEAEGLRWMITHVLENFRLSPWAEVVVGLCTLSILVESGLPQVCTPSFWHRSRRSLKKTRALQITAVCFLAFAVCLLFVVLMPSSPLLSAFGHLSQSPLYYGSYSLAAIVLTLLSVVYGAASGRFLSFADVAQALVFLPSSVGDFFVTLFMGAQFLSCLHYMLGTPQPTLGSLLTGGAVQEGALPSLVEFLLMTIVYGIPLFTSVFRTYVKR